ncbi:hypothetical protein K469DRAFT_653757 [Zopfia rhizophila CBS 207.26]|uniref:Uncharacterized protein n=1 Tax=Zopfia rhizophila CBS 207.26 TaxID=1314779 RepID=A0A6A6EMG4_9PEZI|nr:hypothetical protein K469DRAFT_653757 [Zopfia rhizophila CBS 207.26]
MCNGFSARTSQGGSIAVLRPTQEAQVLDQASSNEEWQLVFSNNSDGQSQLGTQIEFRGWKGRSRALRTGSWVVIHRDGDLSASTLLPLPDRIPPKPLFSFSIQNYASSVIHLPQTLDLGVGETGIIGRRVSVMTGSKKVPKTLAEGIIGWN